MTDYIQRNLAQTATLWNSPTRDVFGNLTAWTKVSIKVRWEDRTDLFIDSSGNEVRARARVYLDRDVALGDYLFLGTSTGADPLVVDDAYQVRDFKKIPNLAGDMFERRVFL